MEAREAFTSPHFLILLLVEPRSNWGQWIGLVQADRRMLSSQSGSQLFGASALRSQLLRG